MTVARQGVITLDCADAAALASFWARLLGGTVVYSTDTVAAVRTDWVSLAFLFVPEFRAPRWPGEAAQMHIDLAVDDLETSVAAAVSMGAVAAGHQPSPSHRRVMLDPA